VIIIFSYWATFMVSSGCRLSPSNTPRPPLSSSGVFFRNRSLHDLKRSALLSILTRCLAPSGLLRTLLHHDHHPVLVPLSPTLRHQHQLLVGGRSVSCYHRSFIG
jgi:hypothetical protein